MSETTGQQTPEQQTSGPQGVGSSLPPPYVPPQPPPPRPPLLRSRDDRMIAGVAGGLARTFGVDPVLFRVVLAVLALAGGTGLLLYLLLWLLIPEEGGDGTTVADRWVRSRSWSTATVLILAVGVAILIGVIVGLNPTPLIVLGVVALVIFLLVRREPRPPAPPGPPVHYGPAVPAAYSSVSQPVGEYPATQPYTAAVAASSVASEGSGVSGGPSDTPPSQETLMTQTYATQPYADLPPPPPQVPYVSEPPAPPPPPKPPREKSALGVLTLGLAAITAGVMVAIRIAGGEQTPSRTAILAATTLVIGLGLLVGTVAGRARWLVLPGVVLLLLTAGSSAAHNLDGPRGDRIYTPTTAAQVQSSYDWGTGRLTIDLSRVQDDPDLTVSADLGAGSLRVIVPEGATLRGVASAGVGSVRVVGEDERGGFGNEVDLSTTTPDGPSNAQTITLDLRVGLGEVVVRRA